MPAQPLEDNPQRMLTIIAERLRTTLSIQDSVLEEYAKVLKAEPGALPAP